MKAPPFNCAEHVRGLRNMNVNRIDQGDRFSSSSECRQVPARMNQSTIGSILKMDPRPKAVAR
jgi:hypothetical protein